MIRGTQQTGTEPKFLRECKLIDEGCVEACAKAAKLRDAQLENADKILACDIEAAETGCERLKEERRTEMLDVVKREVDNLRQLREVGKVEVEVSVQRECLFLRGVEEVVFGALKMCRAV